VNQVRKPFDPAQVLFYVATALLAVITGCQFAPTGFEDLNDPDALDSAISAPDEPQDTTRAATVDAVLARADWVERIRLVEDDVAERQSVWRHAALEDLLSRPADSRPRFQRWLGDADPVVAGNAAIASARVDSDADTAKLARRLAETICLPQLPMPMRLAAAEALGSVSSAAASDELRSLVTQYGDADSEGATPQVDLHAMLIDASLRHGLDESDPIFDAALRSVSPRVQLATLRAWPRDGEQPLPSKIVQLTNANRPELRIAALDLLATRRSPEAMKALQRALNDHYAPVRLAAVSGLGRLGDTGAVTPLEDILQTGNVKMQATAIAALAELGADEPLIAAAGDDAWQVRRAVAAALENGTGRSAIATARRLLTDSNSQVAQQMAATLGTWPLEQSAPLLLDALESSSFGVRQEASKALAAEWPAAGQFRPRGHRGRSPATTRVAP